MTSKEQSIQNQLDAWATVYGIDPRKITFVGYENLDSGGHFVLGSCAYYPDHCRIRLGDHYVDRKLGFLEMCVLWHEYCHAEAYLEDMISDGHGKVFKEKRKRKMKYVIGDVFANLAYPFM